MEWPGVVDLLMVVNEPQVPAQAFKGQTSPAQLQACKSVLAIILAKSMCAKNAFIWDIHPMDTTVELQWQEAFVLKMHLFEYPLVFHAS